MPFQIVEKRIAWINEISAGLGLVIGYLIYSIFWVLTPETKIEIIITEPVFKEVVIGTIPKELITKNIPTEAIIKKMKSEVENKEVKAFIPVLDDGGKPVIKTNIKTIFGLGEPTVRAEKVEILMPHFSNYSYTVTKDNNEFITYFSPNTFYTGTGFFYQKKTVDFSGGKTAEIFAVKVATLFAFMSFMLFLIRICPSPRQLLMKFKKMNFDV